MTKGKVFIGTSGWHYKHWVGTFYDEKIYPDEQFAYYSSIFRTVEINNSFYRLPTISTFKSWNKHAPPKFIFAVKGSRFFTHMKKLNLKKSEIRLFFSRVKYLGNTIGPILFQLPPRWKFNAERFEHFLSILPEQYRYAFEFRDASWYNEEAYALLKKYRCAFCIYELAGHQSPTEVTTDFVYLRLHGPTENKYQGSYTDSQLQAWAKRCKSWSTAGKHVYFYFDNDQAGYAAFNAQKLLQLLA